MRPDDRTALAGVLAVSLCVGMLVATTNEKPLTMVEASVALRAAVFAFAADMARGLRLVDMASRLAARTEREETYRQEIRAETLRLMNGGDR